VAWRSFKEKSDNDQLEPGEIARFTNGAARLMDVYQNGCLVLQRLKTKGDATGPGAIPAGERW